MIPAGWWQYADKPVHSEVLLSNDRHRCVAAARRSGKTGLGQTIAVDTAWELGANVGVFEPTYAQVRELVLEPIAMRLGPELCRFNRNEHRIDFVGGGTLWGKSTERPDLLVGRGYDLVVLDECELMAEQVYDAVIRPMLATTGGRILALGSPRGTENMLYRFFELGQKRLDGWRSWLLSAYEAGTIPTAEIERARTEAERAGPTAKKLWMREWMADFTSFVGQVYPGWDRSRMVVSDLPFRAPGDEVTDETSHLPLPDEVVAGMDWGFSEGHAGAIEVVALHRGRRYVVEEVSAYGKTVPDFWFPQARRLEKRWGIETFYCDPSQRGTIQAMHNELGDANAREANNRVEEGVLCVAGEMENRRLFVHSSCEALIRRLPSYVWEQVAASGEWKQRPKKRADDELDALRYAIASRLLRSEVTGT